MAERKALASMMYSGECERNPESDELDSIEDAQQEGFNIKKGSKEKRDKKEASGIPSQGPSSTSMKKEVFDKPGPSKQQRAQFEAGGFNPQESVEKQLQKALDENGLESFALSMRASLNALDPVQAQQAMRGIHAIVKDLERQQQLAENAVEKIPVSKRKSRKRR